MKCFITNENPQIKDDHFAYLLRRNKRYQQVHQYDRRFQPLVTPLESMFLSWIPKFVGCSMYSRTYLFLFEVNIDNLVHSSINLIQNLRAMSQLNHKPCLVYVRPSSKL